MNKAQRKQIEKLHDRTAAFKTKVEEFISSLSDLKLECEEIGNEIETIRDQEQEKIDSLSENMQSGEKAEAYQNSVDEMEGAMSGLETIAESLEIETEADLLDDVLTSLDNARA